MYDIIGDIHGQASMLKSLLKSMGYKKENGVFSHESRKAVFLGDFINRGPEIRDTLILVRRMVEAGNALAVLGNHELNAIIYELKDKTGKPIAKRLLKYRLPLNQTLEEFLHIPDEYRSHIKWLRTLPMFLELDGIRVVHACWKDENIALLKESLTEGKLRRSFLKKVSKNNSELSTAFWQTCKGIDFQLPKDLLVFDNRGQARRSFRSKWWVNPQGLTFKELAFESRFDLPNYTIPDELNVTREPYGEDEPIVFFGHYCLRNGANILAPNLCCLDSCVSRNGKLAAYRWSGEKKLLAENIVK
ncbi:metallophosphoesterase [Sunxiuqinia elliptica]|uniref:Calcineurin-like phosphoesterase family protein n=1 Tax=Sunxiuqinia elliptica TaxID=655355 RepID=A0A4R6GVQ6_9BACT|nr:metallophosphoesterase [Sunxiuqinia elliptica]TDN98990.1 calcineurin-like phosphoesterase family protein [Sunxiuqinia elliptica]TDO56430.1 calcineurin-like phosphoesterase family protein [Sunxiuqinia elliptica]